MDFHGLTRKELQTLCKKNKIPANVTNVAMADALAALDRVEGLEEFLNQSQTDPQECRGETVIIRSPDAPRTSCRISARRKPAAAEEPESSQQPLTGTRRAKRQGVAEEKKAAEQERSEGVPPQTPAVPSSHRRRAPLASVSKKAEDEVSSVQRVYSTRRSVRLLEKTLEKLSLEEDVKIQPTKIDEDSEETIANCSERSDGSSEKEVFSEKTDDLKADGSSEIQTELYDTLEENMTDRVDEVEDSKSETEIMDSVGVLDEKIDVKDETLVEKEMDSIPLSKFSNGIEDLNSKDSKAHRELGTKDSLAVEISDEVSSKVGNQDIAPQTCRQEEREVSIVEETVESISSYLSSTYASTENLVESQSELILEPVAELESGNFMNLTSEESSKPKIPTVKLPAEILVTLTSNGSSEEESLSEVNNVKAEVSSSESECMTEEESDDSSSEEESLESEASDVEAEISSFESKSIAEEESDNNSSEEESVESEDFESEESEASLVDVHVVEAQGIIPKEPITKEESKETDIDTSLVDVTIVQAEEENKSPCEDVESEELDLEASLVDVNVVEAQGIIPKDEYRGNFDFVLEPMTKAESKETDLKTSLVDVAIVQAEEENKSPLSSIASIKVYAADQLSGQFPRPTLPTPSKSSSKRNHPVIQMITNVLDENEEHTANGDVGQNDSQVDKDENSSDDKNKNSTTKLYEGTSLRQLQKMLKHKLQIKNDNKVGKTRIALQTLPENCLAADETSEGKLSASKLEG